MSVCTPRITRRGRNIVTVLTLLLVCAYPFGAAADTSVVILAEQPRWQISRYLVGMHLVYSSCPDKVFANGKIAHWAKQAGIATARYPGGTVVKHWSWRNPTGLIPADRWSPSWNPSNTAPSASWMSLDEYLAFADRSAMTPMFGVNSLSGYKHGRVEESIRRAALMVRYVKAKGHGGAFWYIGNEESYQYEGNIVGYAEIFRQHAVAMKRVDPAIKIFWNLNHPDPGKIKTFLRHDGGTSDGLETHGKWPYGGDPRNFKPGTFEQWLEEVPLQDRKNHRTWREAASEYRRAAEQAGRKHYLIANNEYGIGKNRNIQGFTRYTYGLLMTELLQELFLGNWDMSCFWDTIRPDPFGLLSPNHGYRLNPFHLGLQLLGEAQGRTMLEVKTNDPRVYGFAAGKGNEILLYLINKRQSKRGLSISLSAGTATKATGSVMRGTEDSWGELAELPVVVGQTTTASLPPLSYCRVRFVVK